MDQRQGRADAGEFRLAAVFDMVDPLTGPGFSAEREVVEDATERAALAGYLRAGAAVLVTPMLMDDVFDTSRRGAVPLNYRTDGEWIWTDTVTYYLEEYDLAPEPGLLAHLRERGDARPQPDAATLQRAADFVLHPPRPAEPVWRPDSD
ncbi:hypothetical protein [Streptomyces sp. NRRL S-350]|uniref:hypothetical protein n=1 Tax=Streptomyces sp. NRRL S-350 TaxID=1463902 RepID=UPI00055D5D88|nr:hypothetical protein [Streptomyces sp. NRRL S-350]